jgi:hypothetical protein
VTTSAVYLLDSGLIINLIVAEPTDPRPYPDCALVSTTGYTVDIGYSWNGTDFLDYNGNIVPPNPPEPEPEPEPPAEEP